MIRSIEALRHVDPGYTQPEQVQTMRIAISPTMVPTPEQVARTQFAIAEKLSAIPGVNSVGYSSAMPNDGFPPNWDSVRTEAPPTQPGTEPPLLRWKNVSPGFLRAMGTRLIAGRDYTWTDIFERRPVVMISETLARDLWGSPSAAIGQRLTAGVNTSWREVIGIAQDVREDGADKPAPGTVIWPVFGASPYSNDAPAATRNVTFTIRTPRAGTEAFLKEIQQAVWSINPNLPVAALQTMADLHNRALARTSFTVVMLSVAGSMALILGIIGIYGVIAYAVSQRRREIGIRMALGAQPATVRRMFLRHGLALTAAGIAIGLTVAAGLSQLIASLLFGVSPLDPPTFIATAIILLASVTAACYIPARRAASIDPVETLRGN
jgi:predicted permease